jgi:hypothetical protein
VGFVPAGFKSKIREAEQVSRYILLRAITSSHNAHGEC